MASPNHPRMLDPQALRTVRLTLRTKTMLILSATFVGLLVLLYVPLRVLVLTSFERFEAQAMTTNVKRATDALTSEIKGFDNIVAGYAVWDDTYNFIGDQNQDYVTINYAVPAFVASQINLVVITDNARNVLFSKAVDFKTQREVPVPAFFSPAAIKTNSLFTHPALDSSYIGLVLLPNGPIAVSSHPVLTSAGEGPIRGTILMGRYLTAEQVTAIADATHLKFGLYALDDPQVALDAAALQAAPTDAAPTTVRTLDAATIAGSTLVQDVTGQPILLRVETDRSIYAQGQTSLRYFTVALLLAGLIVGTVMLVLLERLVLARVSRLSTNVSQLGSDGAARLPLSGHDELTKLAHSVNQMLDTLERTQNERKRLETEQFTALERNNAQQRALVDQLQASLHERAVLSATVRELSVPVIPVLPGVLAVPLIGLFDDLRAGQLLTTVLEAVETERAAQVLLDVTGVPTLDTHVARLLLQLTDAVRLLGAEPVLVGVRPEVAQTLVQLGVDFGSLRIAADLRSAVAQQIGAQRH